jgi:hypothetical protein
MRDVIPGFQGPHAVSPQSTAVSIHGTLPRPRHSQHRGEPSIRRVDPAGVDS